MKKILLIITIVLGIIIPIKVNALEGSFYEAEYIPDAYIKKFNGGSTGKYEQMRVFRRNGDNRVVYCIQLWELMQSNKNIIGYDENPWNYANLSEEIWNKINLIAYYGYGYGESHNTLNWYAASQYMIWHETSPTSTIFFTDTLNGNRNDNKFAYEINEISELIGKHYIKPSFENNTYNVNYGEWATIIDDNNVAEKYGTLEGNGVDFVVAGTGKIKVHDRKIGDTNVQMTKHDGIYDNKPTAYIDLEGQNLLLPGSFDDITVNFTIHLDSTNFTINKLDKDTNLNTPQGEGKLEGSVFELLDLNKKMISTKKVDSNNKAEFNNIGCGYYYISEKSPGIGYLKNENMEKVYICNNNSYNFYNTVIKNKIEITKYLKNDLTNKMELEKNAEFIILDRNNNQVVSFAINKGKYELILPYGTYILKQVSGTKNHKFIDDTIIEVKDNDIIQKLDLYNEELVVPTKIINTDSESNLPIIDKGATFTIKNKETNEETNIIMNNGESSIINLLPGVYEIKQLSAVDNYIINEEVIEIDINDTDFSYNQEVYEIIVPNEKEKSKIEVSKVIKYYLNDQLVDTKKDNSINIDVYAKDTIYTKDGMKIYNENEKVDTLSLRNNPLTKDLVYGNYYINNPVNNEIIDIKLDNPNTKEVEILEEVYKYIDSINIENTYNKKKMTEKFYSLLIILGIIFIYKGKQNEKN